ncbi:MULTISPECIES: SGNH/GDSL hydrolase family protein [Calothrix]|uniref:SGNH/GDSL hydrolase family protein n=2 Tax=Calothrix TaxID=1186 RepID=A0ABR8AG59_9CYAN|nr:MULTISPECIES: SGNH/GDSL hydrolase family protein [Calothrix]MBD2198903.1 SGNH/GDSL hydrolase family protein [Calothrix parietina FACHB-288]MBD2227240.1 SGNH/GDSL hydrolase family protein [Calothrix anomala FACHB-343]
MKKQFVQAGFFLLPLMLPIKANAASITTFNQLYVFGDSLSDRRNTYNASGQTYPPGPPIANYADGRFSNGPLWVEDLGDELNLQPTLFTNPVDPTEGINFAFGGASTGLGNAVRPDLPLPGVLAQVLGYADSLKQSNQKANPNALYTFWAGANDFLFLDETDVTTPAQYVSQALNVLASDTVGVKNLMVFNLPDLGKLPAAKIGGRDPNKLSLATKSFNSALEQTLNILSQKPDLNIVYVDAYSLFEQTIANKDKLGIKNISDACLTFTSETTSITCSNPDEYLFWDEYHPTAATHKLIATSALNALEAKSVPEPSPALGTLAIAAWGTAAAIRRKRKQPQLTIVGRVPGGLSTHIKVES